MTVSHKEEGKIQTLRRWLSLAEDRRARGWHPDQLCMYEVQ